MATPKIHEPDDEEIITILKRNAHEEMRVTLATFKGHQFVNLRLWAEMKDGVQRPTKKGCSIRLSELDHMIDALAYISDLIKNPF